MIVWLDVKKDRVKLNIVQAIEKYRWNIKNRKNFVEEEMKKLRKEKRENDRRLALEQFE
jgi:hypothetical protein